MPLFKCSFLICKQNNLSVFESCSAVQVQKQLIKLMSVDGLKHWNTEILFTARLSQRVSDK
jgi:hypothetical protein